MSVDDNPEIIFDPEAAGVEIYGLNVGQIKKLMLFYQERTADMDFEKLDFYTKGLK